MLRYHEHYSKRKTVNRERERERKRERERETLLVGVSVIDVSALQCALSHTMSSSVSPDNK